MSEAEPEELTPAEIEELTADLVALESEIKAQLSESAESAEIVEMDQPIGRLSRVDAMQGQQMAKASRRRLELRLQQVLAALARVRTGTYGDCVMSGEPIGYRRLKARPETPLSVESQARMEAREV